MLPVTPAPECGMPFAEGEASVGTEPICWQVSSGGEGVWGSGRMYLGPLAEGGGSGEVVAVGLITASGGGWA